MGIIRFLLAISVVVYHSYTLMGERLVGGTVAVQAFYIISGFYMAFILNGKYNPGPGSYRLFISNRFLRLFPAYWVVLLLSIAASFTYQHFLGKPLYLYGWTAHAPYMHWTVAVVAVVANIGIFGTDWMMFMGVSKETGFLELTRDSYMYKPMAMNMLFVPQVWTLGVELTFYLLAPFLVRSKWWIQLILLGLSLGARFVFYGVTDWNYDPWTYRFFPFEIALFLAGSLCYRIYQRIRDWEIPAWASSLVWMLVPACILYYPHAEWMNEEVRKWAFYLIFVLCLPIVFRFTRDFKWDRWIGELSFPIYIVHHLVMMLVKPYFWSHTEHMAWFGWTTVAGTLLMALLIWAIVVRPIERVRARRVSSEG